MVTILPHEKCLVIGIDVGLTGGESQLMPGVQLLQNAVEALKIPYHSAQGDLLTNLRLSELMGILKLSSAGHRNCLLVHGCYLEDQVTALALHALAEGFDVYLITDLIAAREQLRRPTLEMRLYQAGVVPTSLYQLFFLWFVAAEEDQRRETIRGFLESSEKLRLPPRALRDRAVVNRASAKADKAP